VTVPGPGRSLDRAGQAPRDPRERLVRRGWLFVEQVRRWSHDQGQLAQGRRLARPERQARRLRTDPPPGWASDRDGVADQCATSEGGCREQIPGAGVAGAEEPRQRNGKLELPHHADSCIRMSSYSGRGLRRSSEDRPLCPDARGRRGERLRRHPLARPGDFSQDPERRAAR